MPEETTRDIAIRALTAVEAHARACAEQNGRIDAFMDESRDDRAAMRREMHEGLDDLQNMLMKGISAVATILLTIIGTLVILYVLPHGYSLAH